MAESPTTAIPDPNAPPPETWAILEQLGHRRLAGRVSEVEMFGVKMGRIDIPQPDGKMMTKFFGGGSVYSMTIVSEEAARAAASHCHTRPVEAWELPKALPPAPERPAGPERYTYSDSEDDPDRIGY